MTGVIARVVTRYHEDQQLVENHPPAYLTARTYQHTWGAAGGGQNFQGPTEIPVNINPFYTTFRSDNIIETMTLSSLPPTQMFDTVCTYPLTSDVFAQSIHPKSPLLALGLATGHVQVHRLPLCHPPSDGGISDGGGGGGGGSPSQTGQGTIETLWRTRRHKSSCRCLSFSADGEYLFSAGSDDGLVKAAATETGRVVSKIAVPLYRCVDSSF